VVLARRLEENKGAKSTETTGSEVVLKFSGVAVALVGNLYQSGGKADVFWTERRQALPTLTLSRTPMITSYGMFMVSSRVRIHFAW